MPPSLPPDIIYLNGKFIASNKAAISPEDRGFYFADGVYEVIKYYKGRPFCFEDHLFRLQNSLSAVRIDFSGLHELQEICDSLMEVNSLKSKHAGIYLQITRGVATRVHRFPGKDTTPTLYIRAFELPGYPDEMQQGIRVITRKDIRWLRCDIKSIALLPNTLLFQEAAEQNAGECFLKRDGYYTEATHSNIMVIMGGAVYTHPDSNLILPGITKKVVIRICHDLGISVVERPIKTAETDLFEECIITGTGSEIIPVVQIDGRPVADGRPGPVTRKLQNEFFRITYGDLAGENISYE
jgi:D-alanine transaminase